MPGCSFVSMNLANSQHCLQISFIFFLDHRKNVRSKLTSLLSHSMSESCIFVQLANIKTLKSTNSNHVIHFTSILLLDRKIIYSNSLNSMYLVQKIHCTMMLVGNQNQMYIYQENSQTFFLISACFLYIFFWPLAVNCSETFQKKYLWQITQTQTIIQIVVNIVNLGVLCNNFFLHNCIRSSTNTVPINNYWSFKQPIYRI